MSLNSRLFYILNTEMVTYSNTVQCEAPSYFVMKTSLLYLRLSVPMAFLSTRRRQTPRLLLVTHDLFYYARASSWAYTFYQVRSCASNSVGKRGSHVIAFSKFLYVMVNTHVIFYELSLSLFDPRVSCTIVVPNYLRQR